MFRGLVKATRGAEKAGHKYLSRKPDGKGGWRYVYLPEKGTEHATFDKKPKQTKQLSLFGELEDFLVPAAYRNKPVIISASRVDVDLQKEGKPPHVHDSQAQVAHAVDLVLGKDGEQFAEAWQRGAAMLQALDDDFAEIYDRHVGSDKRLHRASLVSDLEALRAKHVKERPVARVVEVGGLRVETLDTSISRRAYEIARAAIAWRLKMVASQDPRDMLGKEGLGKYMHRRMNAQALDDDPAVAWFKLPTARLLAEAQEQIPEWREVVKRQLADAAALPHEHHALLAQHPVRVTFEFSPLSPIRGWAGKAGYDDTYDGLVPGQPRITVANDTLSGHTDAGREIGTTLVHEIGHMLDHYTGKAPVEGRNFAYVTQGVVKGGRGLTTEMLTLLKPDDAPRLQAEGASVDTGRDWGAMPGEWTAEAYRFAYRDGQEMKTDVTSKDFDVKAWRHAVDQRVASTLADGHVARRHKAHDQIEVVGKVDLSPQVIGGEGPVSFSNLVKALRGSERAGHKYVGRKPDGKGGWVYEYVPVGGQGSLHFEGKQRDLDFSAPKAPAPAPAPAPTPAPVQPKPEDQALVTFSDPKHPRVTGQTVGTERMYTSIQRGVLHYSTGIEGSPRPIRRFRLYDENTHRPVHESTSFDGRAHYAHTGAEEHIFLDDPNIARPRIAVIGEETDESKRYGDGYTRGYHGKRRATSREVDDKDVEWLDGYRDGLEHSQSDKKQKQIPRKSVAEVNAVVTDAIYALVDAQQGQGDAASRKAARDRAGDLLQSIHEKDRLKISDANMAKLTSLS